MGDVIDAAEQALGIVALHGDRCAAALLVELERLRRIEMEVEGLSRRESVLLSTCSVLTAEILRLRAIEAALDADAAQGDPCVLCGSYGPVSFVASRRGSFWLCEDATSCRARKGGAK